MALLLAKGDDFTAWDGLESFTLDYRDAVIHQGVKQSPEAIASFIRQVEEQITALKLANQTTASQIEQLLDRLGDLSGQAELRKLTTEFFNLTTRHYHLFAAPEAHFQITDCFLSRLAERCLQLVEQQMDRTLPPISLVALGPAGRCEASRYNQLQLALVWSDNNVSAELMELLGTELVAWLRVCGISVEEAVSPLSVDWRGSLADWQQRFSTIITGNDRSALIDLLRFVDRKPLLDAAGIFSEFTSLCDNCLKQDNAMSNLVSRCLSLSNGIGLMGTIRLERSGPHRDSFSLLNNGLLPLASAVAALGLVFNLQQTGTPARLRELVRIGKLDVDLAERAVKAWYCFNNHRLKLELEAPVGLDHRDILHLSPATLNQPELEQLQSALETAGDLQRYLQVSFGSRV